MTSIDGFRSQWEFVHAMTVDFAKEVPDGCWEYTPHPRFAPFCKQLRHVVCVRGVYNDALATRRASFERKHEQYTGDLSRAQLLVALETKHEQLLTVLERVERAGAADHEIESFGKRFSVAQFGHVIVQHEALHQGEWSVYASLAGFETPLRWRLEWGL